MTKCPSCFHRISTEVYVWECAAACVPEPDPMATKVNGMPTTSKPMAMDSKPIDAKRNWAGSGELRCPKCGGGTIEICPDCHYQLPVGWRQGEATCIAMAGARSTGKSIYIGVMVRQLGLFLHQMGSTLTPATEETSRNFTTFYETPMYVQRGIMAPTPQGTIATSYQREPLVYSMGRLGGIPRYLVIRDVAGEDLERGRGQAGHLGFLADADAVYFMFDPLRVDAIRETLHGVIPPQDHHGGDVTQPADPLKVLDTVRGIIGDGNPRLGVILSKFDAMQALRRVNNPDWQRVMSNSGAAFQRDPTMSQIAYDDADGELLHEEVRSLLTRLHAAPFVTSLENPSMGRRLDFRFFAVSALGHASNGPKLATRGIAPFRCLDPLKWLLGRAGVI